MPRIPLYAHATCVDGPCGDLSGLVVRADSRVLEYYVVQDTAPGHPIEHLVPRDRVDTSGGGDFVHLNCTLAELASMRPLNVQELQADAPRGAGSPASYGRSGGMNLVDAERAPDGTGVLRKTQQVEAIDAKIGKLSGVVMDDEGHITHFSTQLNRHDSPELLLPVAALDYVDRSTVYIRLDKHQIEALPAVPAAAGGDHKQTVLLARTYDTPSAAAEALGELQMAKQAITIREAAVLTRVGDGAPTAERHAQSEAGKSVVKGVAVGAALAALGPVGILAGTVAGGAVGAVVGSRGQHFLSDAFVNALERHVEPDHSTLVLVIEHNPEQDQGNAQSVLDGAISQEQLTDQVVQDLLAQG